MTQKNRRNAPFIDSRCQRPVNNPYIPIDKVGNPEDDNINLILQTVEAEITAMMPLQRTCGAESQVRNKLSNGPLRAQSNVNFTKYSATL